MWLNLQQTKWWMTTPFFPLKISPLLHKTTKSYIVFSNIPKETFKAKWIPCSIIWLSSKLKLLILSWKQDLELIKWDRSLYMVTYTLCTFPGISFAFAAFISCIWFNKMSAYHTMYLRNTCTKSMTKESKSKTNPWHFWLPNTVFIIDIGWRSSFKYVVSFPLVVYCCVH